MVARTYGLTLHVLSSAELFLGGSYKVLARNMRSCSLVLAGVGLKVNQSLGAYNERKTMLRAFRPECLKRCRLNDIFAKDLLVHQLGNIVDITLTSTARLEDFNNVFPVN